MSCCCMFWWNFIESYLGSVKFGVLGHAQLCWTLYICAKQIQLFCSGVERVKAGSNNSMIPLASEPFGCSSSSWIVLFVVGI